MWNILGIEKTTDEAAIKDAYRKQLIYANPEEHPEEFKALRSAYEEACAWAANAKREKGPLEQWVFDMEELYNNFYYRVDEDEWDEIFENEICSDLDTEVEARDAMITFLMHHYLVPRFVWKKMWDTFEFEENKEQIIEKISIDYYNYFEHRANNDDLFDYQLFEGPEDADYDQFITDASMLKLHNDEGAFDKAEQAAERVRSSAIHHPYVDIEVARLSYYKGSDDWKVILADLEAELYEDPYLFDLQAEIKMEAGDYEGALPYLKNAYEAGTNYIQITRHYVKALYETGKYEEGKAICLDMLEDKVPDDYVCEVLMEINEELIKLWKDVPEKKMDLGWCYYQNQRFEDCRELLRTMEPEGEWEFDYYNLLARVLLETKEFETGYDMTKIWIRNIEHLKGDEKDYIRKSRRYGYAHFIASMFCLELGQDEKADAYLNRAIELDHEQMDLLMYRERRMDCFLTNRRFEDCIHEANLCLELSEFFFPAYVYRQEANAGLYRVQQVIDDFHRCVELAPNQGKPYVTLLRMMMEFNAANEIPQIIEMAKNNGVEDPEFEFYALDYERHQVREPVRMREIAGKMKELLDKLPEQEGEISYSLALIFDALRHFEGEEQLVKNSKLSLTYAKKAVKKRNDVPQHHWLLGDIYQGQGEYKKAVHCYQRVIELDPSMMDAYIDLGNAYQQLKETKKAIQAFECAVKIDDRHEFIHNTLMNQYLNLFSDTRKQEYYEKAIMHADRQLEIVQNDYYYRERAYVYIENAEYDKALVNMKKSYELAPEDLYALSSMGYVYRLLGRYEEAIAFYKLAEPHAETDQQKYGLYHWWAPIYTRNGQFEEAIACLERCLAINPKAAEIHEEMGENYFRMQDYKKAIKYYEKAIKENEYTNPYVLRDLARAYYYNKNPLKCRRALKQIEIEFQDDARVITRLGEFYLEDKNDPKNAAHFFKKACDKTFEEPYMYLVEALAKLGKHEEAKKMSLIAIKMLIKLYGSVDGYLNHYGRVKSVYYKLALMYYYAGEEKGFKQSMQGMKEQYMCYFCTYGDCFEQLVLEAFVAADEGRYADGRRFIEQVLSLEPTDSRAGCLKKLIENR
ncbi:MAG: tetratricopeptide repeat protein [Lachnospiraceae bacterium]|nr:tetratricopeptide repeat protein [Lachnospiraceae bacterium]